MSGARATRWTGPRLLITLCWAVPLFFSLFVWEPIWDHYCIVFLPPLAILGALCVRRLWAAPPHRGRGAAAVIDRGQVDAGTGDPFPLVFTGTPAPGSVVALGP